MSNPSTESESRRSGGRNERGGQRRRRGGRNRGGQNRGGQNRGGQNRGGQDRGGQQGRRSGGPRRQPKPAPLTWWQKVLKAVGLYNPDKAKKRTSPSRVPKAPERPAKKAPKSRTRVAKTDGGDRKRRESNPEDVETNRLYVGNLSYDATEYDLEDLFKGIGAVNNIEIVYNRNTHRSKGYCFVVMRSVEDAKRAVEVLHDQPFMGRELIVNGAKSAGPADQDGEDRYNQRENIRPAQSDDSGDDSGGGEGGGDDSEERA